MDDDQDGGWVSVSSGTGSPGWSQAKGHKTVVVVIVVDYVSRPIILSNIGLCGGPKHKAICQSGIGLGGKRRIWQRDGMIGPLLIDGMNSPMMQDFFALAYDFRNEADDYRA